MTTTSPPATTRAVPASRNAPFDVLLGPVALAVLLRVLWAGICLPPDTLLALPAVAITGLVILGLAISVPLRASTRPTAA